MTNTKIEPNIYMLTSYSSVRVLKKQDKDQPPECPCLFCAMGSHICMSSNFKVNYNVKFEI